MTRDTAMKLAAFFNTSAEFWVNLQKTYQLRLRRTSGEKMKEGDGLTLFYSFGMFYRTVKLAILVKACRHKWRPLPA